MLPVEAQATTFAPRERASVIATVMRGAHGVSRALGLDLIEHVIVGEGQVLRQGAPLAKSEDAVKVIAAGEPAVRVLTGAGRDREAVVVLGQELAESPYSAPVQRVIGTAPFTPQLPQHSRIRSEPVTAYLQQLTALRT